MPMANRMMFCLLSSSSMKAAYKMMFSATNRTSHLWQSQGQVKQRWANSPFMLHSRRGSYVSSIKLELITCTLASYREYGCGIFQNWGKNTEVPCGDTSSLTDDTVLPSCLRFVVAFPLYCHHEWYWAVSCDVCPSISGPKPSSMVV